MYGNAIIVAGALALTRNCRSSGLAMASAALAWLIVYDTLRPLRTSATPKKFEHAKSRQSGEDIPPPYPDGWYCLLYSFELAKGEVKSVRALGREFAVWRSESGEIAVFGAYCPHLGANLAIGGKVVNGCLECPFHGWQFDCKGSVKGAVGCSTAPAHGHAETYISVERNNMILIWFDGLHDASRRGRPVDVDVPPEIPAWNVPEEHLLKETTELVGCVEHILAAHIQEVPENGADGAHLLTVHAPFVVSWLSRMVGHEWNFTWTPGSAESRNPHTAVVGMNLGLTIFGYRIEPFTVLVHVTQIGPALVHEELSLPLGLGKVYFASSVTPIKPLLQRYTHVMWCSPYLPRFIAKTLLRGLKTQVDRDVPIWNNKKWRSKPAYSKADANIPPFRRWFKQFYSPFSETFQQAIEIEKQSMSLEW